jgi:hypothetical protein
VSHVTSGRRAPVVDQLFQQKSEGGAAKLVLLMTRAGPVSRVMTSTHLARPRRGACTPVAGQTPSDLVGDWNKPASIAVTKRLGFRGQG